ncbi:glycoside hydrolase family 15 protein [Streptomyces antnestii]|uniref:glycoside hydrolase family 15 protein n=1 Tax=Streptomyces antnestii TaxID=2494256 RepID=UPI001CB88DA9|nr:glycoside hydrolase family 15 protein [Streptomyces sp. San01]
MVGVQERPIADYALLSDCQGAALVARDGSVDWLCLPRFDAPSLFARLLDRSAGHWWIRPVGVFTVRRAYVGPTMVLRTEFRTDSGTVEVTDALAAGPNEGGRVLGRVVPNVLVRVVECTRGSVRLAVEFAPRPDYGAVRPLLAPADGGLLCPFGSGSLMLSSPVRLEGRATARGQLRLDAGERVGFALQYVPVGGRRRVWSQEDIEGALGVTLDAWRSWAALNQRYEGPWQDAVHLSGRVLQALTYAPTGAIVAAPTTSLPEAVGGERNWDYRFSWVRDASFTLRALSVAACPGEAEAFFTWMARTASAEGPADGNPLQVLYGVGGERELTEHTLGHLSGWGGSRPVRIGNDAWRQRQLDIYGELLDAAYLFRGRVSRLDSHGRGFLMSLADAAAAHWREPDHSIWEVRGRPQHFVYSKLMCWVALDRAIALADELDAGGRVPAWTVARAEVRTAIEEHGWSRRAGSYSQALGSDLLDASALMLPITGFVLPDDPRARATVAAVRERLTGPRGLVHRYERVDDGLAGEEGAFVMCSFWLAHALALTGEVSQAREVFERAAACANDVGLFSEEVDPVGGQLLGNFPQALSHIGLVNAAWAIGRAQAA